MKKEARMKRLFLIVSFLVMAVSILGAKDYNVKGIVLNQEGKKVSDITVLLLAEDGSELQRTETSGGLSKGKFKFKNVLAGSYTLDVDAGDDGVASAPITVIDDDVEDVELKLGRPEPKPAAVESAPETAGTAEIPEFTPVETAGVATTGEAGPDQNYILNELSFEIKKMAAEIKHLNSELNELKALSKMWVNPLAVYSKEIIMKNGSTVFGKIVYQDEKTLKVETLVGYLILQRENIVRVIDNVVTEEQPEYVPEQIRDSYSPPPMPKLAEPKYTSGSTTERTASKKYSANCVLVGNITENKDNQGNLVFQGEIKNIGGRRADFVKIDFVFRKNWSGETKTLTTFVKGAYYTFDSGITTDATLLPGAVGSFELYVPHSFGSFIGYSYVIDWEEYQ